MYHSITIGTDIFNLDKTVTTVTKNTWDDWHLIPATRPLVKPPSPKINRIEIPGGDGSLDLTNVLAGRPTYSDRSGSWSFYVENGFKEWSVLYSEIMTYLHGKELQCSLEDDPFYYYEGRFAVNEWRSDPYNSVITINYVLGPYKQFSLSTKSTNFWLWDSLSFGDPNDPTDKGSEITSYYRMEVKTNTPLVLNIDNDYATDIIPTISTNKSGITLIFNNKTHKLNSGVNVIDEVVLTSGRNRLEFRATNSNSRVSVHMMGGRL